jgi:hypothetical protein
MLVLSSVLLWPIHYKKPCPFQLHFGSPATNVETTNLVAILRLLICNICLVANQISVRIHFFSPRVAMGG